MFNRIRTNEQMNIRLSQSRLLFSIVNKQRGISKLKPHNSKLSLVAIYIAIVQIILNVDNCVVR